MILKAISKEEDIRLCNEFSWHRIEESGVVMKCLGAVFVTSVLFKLLVKTSQILPPFGFFKFNVFESCIGVC
jgi:hypothetical protein